MIKNTIRLLWFGKTDLSPDRQYALLGKLEGDNDVRVYYCPDQLPMNSADATRQILCVAEKYKSTMIAGEFEPHVAAQLVRSQTFGGRFSRYVIALPVQDSWEIFL